jgi:hypothetical protein
MLGILPARPTDEPAAFGPGDSQLFGCLHSHTRALAIEELAPLPVSPASSVGSAGRLARRPAEGRETLTVETAQLLEPERCDEGHRLVDRSGPAILYDIFQNPPQAHGELYGLCGRAGRLPYEQSYRVRPRAHLPRFLVLVESLDLFGRESYAQKVRGRFRRGR